MTETTIDPTQPLANPKEELFAQNLLQGHSQARSYKNAGYTADDAHASRMASYGRVRSRLAYLQSEVAQLTLVTVAGLTEELKEVLADAKDAGDLKQIESVVMNIAKLNGLIVDKSKVDQTIRTVEDTLAEVPDFTPEQRRALLEADEVALTSH